jgi:uncharacterized protein (TIGR03067 family)
MKMFGKIATAGLLYLLTTVLANASDENKEEVAKFEGTWAAVSYVENGHDDGETGGPAEESLIRWVFKGDKVTLLAETEEAALKGSFKLDPKPKTKTIDMVFPPAPDSKKDQTVLGIYEFEGNKLKICYGLDGVKRPTEFKSKPKSSHIMIVFEKLKNEKSLKSAR